MFAAIAVLGTLPALEITSAYSIRGTKFVTFYRSLF
jgi:hypothetical protein